MATYQELMETRDLSFVPTRNDNPRRLSAEQIAFFNQHGYLKPFRIYDEAGAE
ncbi:MAG: hypothetical protein H7Y15_19095, partial [Pseudonocardia sp.]|nr:hypothetical protein [Pseudonocardia sp.]